MHRFESSHPPQFARGDGRGAFYQPSPTFVNNPFSDSPPPLHRQGGHMPCYSNTTSYMNRVYSPGSNQRLPGLFSSGPGGGDYYNRMNYGPGPYGNCGMAEPPAPFMPPSRPPRGSGSSYTNAPTPSAYGNPSFGNGYGAVGVVGGGRFHPYNNNNSYQPPPPAMQQHQRSGFLEQLLLKNRGGAPQQQHTGYYPPQQRPYAGAMPQQPPMSGSQYGAYNGNYGHGYRPPQQQIPYGATRSHSAPFQQQQHHYPQQNSWARGGVGGQQWPHFKEPTIAEKLGFISSAVPNPFKNFARTYLPMIKNDHDEGLDELHKADTRKTETRYQRNHERMHAIMNENLANCDPILVPVQRVNNLRHHVHLLKDELLKQRENAKETQETCSESLQLFKDSTAKFHSDYKKLCQPISAQEYDSLVEKHYQEMKAKLEQKRALRRAQQEQQQEAEKGDDDVILIKEEATAASASLENKAAPILDDRSRSISPPAEEFYPPLFMDIPAVSNEARALIYKHTAFPSSPFLNKGQMFPTPQSRPPPPPPMSTGGELCYEPGGGEQQQSAWDNGYYTATGGMDSSGGWGNSLMSAQQPPPLQPQASMRWHQGNNSVTGVGSNANYSMGNQGYSCAGFGSQPQNLLRNPGPETPPSVIQQQQNKRMRPTEELQDFIWGLMRGKYHREGENMIAPQVAQLEQPEVGVPPPTPGGEQLLEGPSQQRRLMSGGGIVEVVKHEMLPQPPEPPQSQSVYDDAATRDWINALSTGDDVDDVESGMVDTEAQAQPKSHGLEENNNNLDLDLSNNLVDSSTTCSPTKTSKIAELLEGPCLNNNSEELESELRQLEDVLNGNVESTSNHADVEILGMDGVDVDADNDISPDDAI